MSLDKIGSGEKYEALWKQAQDESKESPFKKFLDNPHADGMDAVDLLNYVLQKDDSGSQRVMSVAFRAFTDLLLLARAHHVKIDLNEADVKTGKTLFRKWATKNCTELTTLMVDEDPSVVHQIPGGKLSMFETAVCGMYKQGATHLLKILEEKEILLSERDQWIKRAFSNEGSFPDADFMTLPQNLKAMLFRIANAHVSPQFIKKVRPLGFDEKPFPPLIGVELIAPNMDVIKVADTLENFLKDLRQKGLLITENEFALLDKTKYRLKSCSIGRFLGKNHLERTAQRLGLTHMKVPKKIGVIRGNRDVEDPSSVWIGLRPDLEPTCDAIEIYAEEIAPVERKLSREELEEFLSWMIASGFNDFINCRNFIIAAEAVYAVDTEYHNFSASPCFDDFFVKQLNAMVADADREWLAAELADRIKKYKESQIEADWNEEPIQTTYHQKFIAYGFRDRLAPFIFKVDDLLTIEKVFMV